MPKVFRKFNRMNDQDPTKIKIVTDPLKKRMVGRTMIGGHDFDVPYMSEVVPGLWQGGCETGLVLPTHINYLVSLYPWERYTINHKMRGELYIRMYDDPEQVTDQVETIAKQVNEWRKAGKGNVLVHCQAGLNRSSLIIVRALMLDGMKSADAIELVRKQRSPACLSNYSFETYLRSLDS